MAPSYIHYITGRTDPGVALLWTWVLVADITDELNMGPDALHLHDTSMELKCHVLQ